MRNLFSVELKMNYKKIIIPTIIMASLVFGCMLFFPLIAENIGILEGFFQQDLMKNMLGAFGINSEAFGSLLGFYTAYASMWVVLVGSIFFSYFSSEMIAKEEKTGSIEYLLARPTSRSEIYSAKYLTSIVLILTFMLVVGIIGYGSLEVQKNNAPYQLDITKHTVDFEEKIINKSVEISSWISMKESDFNQFTYSVLLKEYQSNEIEIQESGIPEESIDESLKKVLESPEQFFLEIKSNPKKYLKLFNAQMSEEQFLQEVEKSEQEFKQLKATFLTSTNIVKDFYKVSPSFFLGKIMQTNKVDELNSLLKGAVKNTGVFAKYDRYKYMVLTVYMLLIILALASLSFAFSAIMRGDFGSPQVTMVAILIMYFINSFASISSKIEFLKYFTPFGYINTNVAEPNYSLSLNNVLIILAICLVSYIVGLLKYRKKNFS